MADICHTFASRALALGESLTMIGKLSVTRRCRRPPGMHTWLGTRSITPLPGSPEASAGICRLFRVLTKPPGDELAKCQNSI